MFTSIRIRNFKALRDVEIPLAPITILIGENSCGKSTVLQALDLLVSIARGPINDFFDKRHWTYEEVHSKFVKPDEPISFELTYESASKHVIRWLVKVIENDGDFNVHESVDDFTEGINLLYHGSGNGKPNMIRYDHGVLYIGSDVTASYLSLLESFGDAITGVKPVDGGESNGGDGALRTLGYELRPFDERLVELKDALYASNSFELLSPSLMRGRGRSDVDSIGMGGEHLASYLFDMGEEGRSKVSEVLSELLETKVRVEAHRGYYGWIDATVREIWEGESEGHRTLEDPLGGARNQIGLDQNMMSDGLLRLLALSAIYVGKQSRPDEKTPKRAALNWESEYVISERQPKEPRLGTGFMLLDEVEDGTNPHITGSVLDLFRELADSGRSQTIITSHSPILVNYVDSNGIVYMWREADGAVHVKPMFASERMKRMLSWLHAGEVWLNFDKADIVAMVDRNESPWPDEGDDWDEGEEGPYGSTGVAYEADGVEGQTHGYA